MRNDDNVEYTDEELEVALQSIDVNDEGLPDLDSVEDDGYDISELEDDEDGNA